MDVRFTPKARGPIMVNTEVGSNMQIYDLFILGERRWNIASTTHLFGDHLAKKIQSLPIPRYNTFDRRVWCFTYCSMAKAKDLYDLYRVESD